MAKVTSSNRILSKTSLTQAVQAIGSERVKDTTKKPARWVLIPNIEAQRILLRVVAPNANVGWQVLRALDDMGLYGYQIPIAFNEFCIRENDLFILYVTKRNQDMINYIDKRRRELKALAESAGVSDD